MHQFAILQKMLWIIAKNIYQKRNTQSCSKLVNVCFTILRGLQNIYWGIANFSIIFEWLVCGFCSILVDSIGYTDRILHEHCLLDHVYRVFLRTHILWISRVITRLIVIDIAPLTVLFCNCPLLKDISFNTKCFLVWCDWPVITCLVREIFGINHLRDFSKLLGQFQNFQKCIRAIYPKSPSQICDY